jgi:hypothetical protein
MVEPGERRGSDEPGQTNSTDGSKRLQKPGEAGTTRFGMEEGDNTDVPATGVDPEQQSPPPSENG